MGGFESFLRLLKDNDLLRSGTLNRPLREIDQNVRYVYDVLQAAGIGATVRLHRQSVDVATVVGTPVWFNPSTTAFEPAFATADIDNVNGAVIVPPQAQVWGIVSEKINDTLAEILLFGVSTIDLSAVVAREVVPGIYYLSSATPGKLTTQMPPVSIPVLRVAGNGQVFVQPRLVDALDRHTHYRFALTAKPAGNHVPPSPGTRHTITNPDSDTQGWLPADHVSFAGHAPPGAAFGYNLTQHPELNSLWPPIPFGNVDLLWDKGLDAAVAATSVPLGENGLCVVDRYGIWWMSDCYGDVPWPLDFDSANSLSYSDGSDIECARHLQMALTLYFTRINFFTDLTAVLSLHSKTPRIKITCYGTTTPASAGHLDLDLDLNLTVVDDQTGFLALKAFDPVTAQFQRGPVVEGVYALGSNVHLTAPVTSTREINGVNRTVYGGLVGLTVTPSNTVELDPQLVRLDGVEEAFYGEPPVMYLGFMQGRQRSYRVKFQVPDDLAISSPTFKLRLRILGRAAGTLPQLAFTARQIPKPSALNTPTDLPMDSDEFSVACTTTAVLTDTNQYVEVESTAFEIAAGDTIFLYVTRSDSDAYAAEVGVLSQIGVIESEA